MKRTFLFTCLTSIILLCCQLYGETLLNNGNFMELDKNSLPADWDFSVSENAKVAIKIVPTAGHDSLNALKITNDSPLSPHVFGTIVQRAHLKKGLSYEVNFWIKGRNARAFYFTYGRTWENRFYCKDITGEWKKYSYVFTPEDAEFEDGGGCMIRFNTDDVSEEVLISDISMKELNSLREIPANSFQQEKVYIMTKSKAFSVSTKTIPENLNILKVPYDASRYSTGKMPEKEDLSLENALQYDDKGLIILAKVSDDRHFTNLGDGMWMGDSIQICIDQGGQFNIDKDSDDLEIGFSVHNGESQNWCWTLGRSLTPAEVEYSVSLLPDGYFVTARINWSFLSKIDISKKGFFSYNIIVNDNDNGSNREVAFLSRGIHDSKSCIDNIFCIPEEKASGALLKVEPEVSGDILEGKVVVNGNSLKDGQMKISLVDSSSKIQEYPIASSGKIPKDAFASADIRLDLKDLSPGRIHLSVKSGTNTIGACSFDRKDYFKECREALSEIKADYEKLSSMTTSLKDSGVSSSRLDSKMAISARQIKLLEKDIEKAQSPEEMNYYGRRGLRISQEMRDLLSLARSDITSLADKNSELKDKTYKYISSPRTMKDGFFEALTIDVNGMKDTRPIIFSGYLSFTGRNDIALYSAMGMNVMQMEIGPRSVVKGESPDGKLLCDVSEIRNSVLPVLENFDKNNMTLMFLLSPHYFPDWALKKYPELSRDYGFLKYEFDHPIARKIIEAYLRTTVEEIKNSPHAGAIHSLCITNEPIYKPSLKNQFTREKFTAYLKEKYGDAQRLNSVYGTSFKTIEEAVPGDNPLNDEKQRSVFYDFNIFKMKEFADWHSWMISIVKEIWPEVKVHAKEMIFDVWTDRYTLTSADPELFSKFSDLNGNDNIFFYKEGGWYGNWLSSSMNYSLQSSMKPVHIVNSENHIIVDRDEGKIPYDFIYTSLFQQFMHGCGSSTIWVWENSDYEMYVGRHDFVGDIYRRPMSILAASDATMDANRLSKEIRKFFNSKPQVAMLYSRTSNILSPAYQKSSEKIFTLLSFCGRKIGFLSEEQIQKRQFGDTKILFAADARYLEPETLAGLADFAKNGGAIISYGECFKSDAYGKPLKLDFKTEVLKDENTKPLLMKSIAVLLDGKLDKLPVSLSSNMANGLYGIEWREIPSSDGSFLLNAVNYNFEDVEVSCENPEGTKITNLIDGKNISGKFILKPAAPVVLKISR